jgi:AraC-like DNA-binding protein
VHFDWVPPPADLEQRPLAAFEHERFEALGQTVAPPPEIAVCLPLVVALRELACNVQPALMKTLKELRAGHYGSAGGWLWPVLNVSLRHVAFHVAKPAPQVGGAALAAVHAAKDYMDCHYATPVTLDQLASLTRVSPNHLCVTFRRVVGKPPNQYLNDLRVQHACRLLGTSHLNVAEVAAHVGVPDANYFARLFKQKTGYRPGNYANHRHPSSIVAETG